MIELQLVGYTADLEYLVFCDAAEGASRFKATVDEDLLATLTEVVERTDPGRRTAFLPPSVVAPPPPPPPPPPSPPPTPAAPLRTGPRPGVGPLAAVAVLLTSADDDASPEQVTANGSEEVDNTVLLAPASRGSRLSPREIQALLRMGRTPAAIAKQAGVDENWVQRWLPPIEAERERIIASARSARVSKARKGDSAAPLGEAVDRNLADKNADSDVEWSATRRDGDAHWVVAVRYRSRGKNRRARWRFNPDTGVVEAEDTAARDLAWRSRTGARRSTATPRTAPSKRTAAKKPGPKKKAAVKSATAKKTAAKKATTKKATTKKATTKKATTKKATTKKSTPKTSAAKATPSKTATARKAAPRKAPTKRTPPVPAAAAPDEPLLPPPMPVAEAPQPPPADPAADVGAANPAAPDDPGGSPAPPS